MAELVLGIGDVVYNLLVPSANYDSTNMNILTFFSSKGPFGFATKAQNTIISAAFALAISSGVTAFLGLVKARLLTSHFGVSDDLGIFYTADRIPNLVFSVLVVGALSTIFIPIFTQLLQKDKKLAWETASSVISVGLLAFMVIGGLVFVFAPQIISILSVGKFTPQQVALGAGLMRIMIAAQLILVLSSFITSVLQSFKYFVIPALAPILYNFGMIVGIVFLSSRYGIFGPAYGVMVGAFLHLAIQLPILKKIGFSYKPIINPKNANVRKMFALMPPRIASVVFSQLVATINNSLAILISTSSVVILKFASQLQFFPVHLFGASMAAASLPVLSEHSDVHEREKFKRIFLITLHQMLFFVMPASVILLILRIPVVRLVYGVSNFPWEATVKTSYALAFFSISIFAQSIVYLLTRAFYALKDTFTPVKVSFVTIVLNVSLSVFFVRFLGLGIWSIALAYSITSFLDMIFMFLLLSKKLGGFKVERVMVPFTKISYASVFMGISLYAPLKYLDELVLDTTRTINLIILTAIAVSAGIASYLFFTWILKVEEIELLYRLLRKLKIRETVPATRAGVIAEQKEGI